MAEVRRRKTGFFERVRQAVTGQPSRLEQECRDKLAAAEERLRLQLSIGKITQAQLDQALAELRRPNGTSHVS